MENLEQAFVGNLEEQQATHFQQWIGDLIQPDQFVGHVFGISYEEVTVQVHDTHRQRAGGIPAGCFLLATRLTPAKGTFNDEDAALILLRVMDSAELPDSSEAVRIRSEASRQATGRTDAHWDSTEFMDSQTNNLLSFAGLKCKVLGTFYVAADEKNPEVLNLNFGSDLANFYPNRGLTVYKPIEGALEKIVNYADPMLITSDRLREYHQIRVPLGEVRYSSTYRPGRAKPENAKIWLHPANLLSQKTAVFGMSRTGKSNTIKIICQSVFDLRFGKQPLRVGQVIFDYNGEYANDNPQDHAALFNVWKGNAGGKEEDVVRYGLLPQPTDPKRKIMKLNFFNDALLETGKELIDGVIAGETANYFKNFAQVRFGQKPPPGNTAIRHDRRVLVYRALLARAGYQVPKALSPYVAKLFSKDLQTALTDTQDPELVSAATVLSGQTAITWGDVGIALTALNRFLSKEFKTAYNKFEADYVKTSSSGNPWADQDLKNLLAMFGTPNGIQRIGDLKENHTATVDQDYAIEIYKELQGGKLVIIDQSSAGSDEIKQLTARRVMTTIFEGNFKMFRQNECPSDILVYAEEAHNLLPAGNDLDLKNVWVRTSKEGAKCNIGLAYITQEPSSIQKNILKNTANFFIAHLNNEDEIREVSKYYDFEDFAASIRRAPDRGFVRVKTLTNSYTIPAMIEKFYIP
ncbi:MAG: hypothetical protein QOK24_2713 [Verrucomicrobiota bacterium]|jgi:hypothetical protein